MKIAMYDLEGNFLDVFNVENIVELENKLNFKQGQIDSCVTNRVHSTNGRQFKIMGRSVLKQIGSVVNVNNLKSRPVLKYYNGRFISSYKSVVDAGNKNCLKADNINKCCQGKQKTAGGFSWKYADYTDY
jgi:hypothetical protein